MVFTYVWSPLFRVVQWQKITLKTLKFWSQIRGSLKNDILKTKDRMLDWQAQLPAPQAIKAFLESKNKLHNLQMLEEEFWAQRLA